jgi:alanine racemase
MGRALRAIINTAALKHNFQCIKQKAKSSKILAMIKANGYGHGIVNVAKILKDADAFGVACIEEALKLREAGIQNRIVLMEGFFKSDELENILRYQLEPVIHHQAQMSALMKLEKPLAAIAAMGTSNPLKIWIKVDTGMHRLGFPMHEFQEAYSVLNAIKMIQIQGFMTHFSSADEKDNPKTKTQISLFQNLVKDLPGDKSLANSAGIWGWPDSHGDFVRPGIMLYGVSPFANQTGIDLGLKPAMTLTTSLISIQNLKKGEQVGYGGIYTCEQDMPIGVVAVGYADGYPRHAPHNTPVLLNGKKVPLVGRVSMDMITIDLRSVPNAKVGDPIELWGAHLPVEIVAAHMGTLGYELLTSLSPRVPILLQ